MNRSADLLDLLTNKNVRKYATSILGATERAEDVLQTVAENILRKGSEAEQAERMVFPMVRNAAIDAIRRVSRRDGYEGQFARENFDRSIFTIEAQAERDQLLSVLLNALNELPLLTQSLFVDHHLFGYSQQELAQRHNLHLSTIEKRLAKAKKHCRNCLIENTR
ncbi:MAG: sigma-70 family RNA polymerase sigma factor [Pseudomonadota bacterium]